MVWEKMLLMLAHKRLLFYFLFKTIHFTVKEWLLFLGSNDMSRAYSAVGLISGLRLLLGVIL